MQDVMRKAIIGLFIALLASSVISTRTAKERDRLQEELDYVLEHYVSESDAEETYDELYDDADAYISELLAENDALRKDLSRLEDEPSYDDGYREGWNEAVYYSFDFLYEYNLDHLELKYEDWMHDHW